MPNKTPIISFFLFASLALANDDNVKEKGATGKPDLLRESRFLMPSNNPGAAKKGNTAAKAAKGAKVGFLASRTLLLLFDYDISHTV